MSRAIKPKVSMTLLSGLSSVLLTYFLLGLLSCGENSVSEAPSAKFMRQFPLTPCGKFLLNDALACAASNFTALLPREYVAPSEMLRLDFHVARFL